MFEDLIADLQGPAADLLQASGEAGLLPRVTSTRRTRAAQEKLYRRWQSGLSPFPAAPPGLSAHEYGFAFDMVVSPFEALADVGATWASWGGVWGGERDPVHFEYPGFVVPEQESGSKIAEFINTWFLSVGPWWSPLSGKSLLEGAVAVEKRLGFDAAIDWFYRHVAVNPDKP